MIQIGFSKPSWTGIEQLRSSIPAAKLGSGHAINYRSNQSSRQLRLRSIHLKLRSTILDGEIVALDKDGIPRFQLLQQWQKRPTADNRNLCILRFSRAAADLV
jgi:hypothetical protein